MKRNYKKRQCGVCYKTYKPTAPRQNKCPACMAAGLNRKKYEQPSLEISILEAKEKGLSYGQYKAITNPEIRVII